MHFHKALFVIILVGFTTLKAQLKTNNIKHVIYSVTLDESRSYEVYLPLGYAEPNNKNVHYPVFYVLDGEKKGDITQAIYQYLSDNLKPMVLDIIIVAVHQKDRFYELTPNISKKMHNGNPIPKGKPMGGADKFLNFLQDELAPVVQLQYRTNAYKGIIGHSLGGLFVLHAIQQVPDYYSSAIAIDPSLWWNDGYIVKEFNRMNEHYKTKLILVAAKSASTNQNQHIKDFNLWLQNKQAFSNYYSIMFPNKNHHTVVIPAIQEGFNQTIGDDSFLQIKTLQNKAGIIQYYIQKGAAMGVTLDIPYHRWIKYATILERLGKKDEAQEIYNYLDSIQP